MTASAGGVRIRVGITDTDPHRSGDSPRWWGLGDDLDADEISGVGVAELGLSGEHGLEASDRDGELGAVGFARRQVLELDAWPHDGADPTASAVSAAELDQLEGDASDQGDADDAREQQPVPGRQSDGSEDEDRDDHHQQQEGGPAAGMEAREALGVLRRERHAGLEARDRLVLGAVVLEHAPEISQARERQQVAEEDGRADQALDEPEEER